MASTSQESTAPGTPKKPPGSRPRISGVKQAFATVIVGEAKAEFVVHEALLTHYSEFFRAALLGRFQEAETKTVTLKDQNPVTFEIFIHWLYHQRFPHAGYGDDKDLVALYGDPMAENGVSADAHRTKTQVLVRLYVFGDAHQAVRFKNDALRTLFAHLNGKKHHVPCPSTYTYAFSRLANTDALCRLLVDHHCLRTTSYSCDVDDGNCPFDTNFLFEVAKRWVCLVHGKPQTNVYSYSLTMTDYVVKAM
ncbi:uncharacterized protein N0V89_000080 [Didymosphaeria variabile]|uniref:BTB domain-containing protein n=1 Tax=Didymosphaeria variabile TaxID=1932322 RepID=A0A9W9CFJ9_9PLEO|nr:uncharacterized protein N0V89_000080 [Didymosphaeria variabile]KAJ4359525.1 hypothetical protein N0V89_000080 [Didymosphaeria variabile]